MKNHKYLTYLDATNRFQSPSNKLIQSESEGKKHFELKSKLFEYLTKQHYADVRCECIFANGKGKADVIDFTNRDEPATVYEIRVSEPMSSIENKKNSYPCKLFKFRVIENEDDIYLSGE